MSTESMDIVVTLPGGKKVDADIKGFTIKTDQPVDEGGEGSAPEPFMLFLASIGTCAGIYVKGFCDVRNIPADKIRLIQRHEFIPETHRLEKLSIEILVPPAFPKKYHKAIVRVANLCTVKKSMLDPPEFEIVVNIS